MENNTKNINPLEKKFEELRERLENSSRSNKGFSIVLLSYATYLLVATFSTKDLQLLFPELGVHLPILNIDINLTAFMIIAPLLLTILYINSLLNLYKHYELINEYKTTAKELGKDDIALKPIIPFMFDNAFLHKDGDKSAILFKAISYLVLLIYPLLILWVFFWRFTAYQDAMLTFLDYSFILIAFTSLILFLYFATQNKNSKRFFKWLKRIIYSIFVFLFWINFIILIIYINNPFYFFNPIYRFIYYNFFYYLTYHIININKFNYINLNIINVTDDIIIIILLIIFLTALFILAQILGFFYKVIIYFLNQKIDKSFPKINLRFELLLIFPLFILLVSMLQLFFSTIVIYRTDLLPMIKNSKEKINKLKRNKILFFIEIKPTEQIPFPDVEKYSKYLETFQKLTKKEKDDKFEIREESLPRLDLSKKNLKFAKLRYVFLPYADLENANFQSANLSGANLQHADLENANFQSADLEFANLQDINFKFINFEYANLQHADLQNIDFNKANLQHTNLQHANLQHTNLCGKFLQYANLQNANLQYAKLSGANLQHANLQYAKFQGANLKFANLRDANLQNADLQHANLIRANLQHADLQYAKFQGADLEFANLQDANLQNADLQGAFLFKTHLYGIKEYKTATYKNTLVIAPDFSKPKDIKNNDFNVEEARKFFDDPKFHNFEGWFEAVKESTINPKYKVKTIRCVSTLFYILLKEKFQKFHKDVWLTIVRFIKYWEKEKPDNLRFMNIIRTSDLKKFNQNYSTKELYLTDEEIKMIEKY